MSFKFIEDPGHGWCEVPRATLIDLGIAHAITHYSYQSKDGSIAYLEEDCDYSAFYTAWVQRYGVPPTVKSEYQEHTFVRSLPSYRPA